MTAVAADGIVRPLLPTFGGLLSVWSSFGVNKLDLHNFCIWNQVCWAGFHLFHCVRGAWGELGRLEDCVFWRIVICLGIGPSFMPERIELRKPTLDPENDQNDTRLFIVTFVFFHVSHPRETKMPDLAETGGRYRNRFLAPQATDQRQTGQDVSSVSRFLSE